MATIFSEWKRCVSLAVLVVVVAVFTFLVPVRSEAAPANCFLRIDGLKGESLDSKHKDEIEVLTWGFGDSILPAAAGAGRVSGRYQMQDLRFTARIGVQSPMLFQRVANGMLIKSAVLTCRKPPPEFVEYFTVTLTDVLVTGYQTGMGYQTGVPIPTGTQAQASIDPYPVDQVTLNFTKIKVEYWQWLAPGRRASPLTGTDPVVLS